ncbi:MAG: DUF6526 family protein [Thermoanaerobaculia bacterium]|nr:DUF6526 family protein [Thermoanaerobaculia bacterium]
MAEQSYANHRRYVPGYHVVLLLLLLATLIGSFVNLYKSWGDESRFYGAALIVALALAASIMFFFLRDFALKAQDRAIRAEENLRHYVLTGELLDPRLTIRQVIGLRFAADEEFVELARSAAEHGTSEEEIKKSIRSWRADTYRV